MSDFREVMKGGQDRGIDEELKGKMEARILRAFSNTKKDDHDQLKRQLS